MSQSEELQAEGVRLFQAKEFEAAARVFQQAQEAYEAEDNPAMAAEMMTNLGLVHRSLGESQQALEAMQGALQVFRNLEDARRTAMVLGNMGGVYVALGDKEQAYNCYRQAADIFEEIGEKKLYGETLIAMGALQVKDGKVMAGAATYEVGLEQLDQLSASQKIIKGLLNVRNKFTGGTGA